MNWTVRFKWLSGDQFTYNCYHHWATLVICDAGGMGQFIHIKEGLIQGYPLGMIAYRIIILPLIREIQAAHPQAVQP